MEELPLDVMVDILSRLPVKTIMHCKLICKKWLDLISHSYFANLHLKRSPASLMIHHNSVNENSSYHEPGILKWVEVEHELDHHHFQNNLVMSLNLNLASIFQESHILLMGAVNGFLCLWQYGLEVSNTYICNPITREYMILPKPQYSTKSFGMISQCFGIGSLEHEYKVIRICQDRPPQNSTPNRLSRWEAKVYTLGTGQWRSVGRLAYRPKEFSGLFLNGHAHWIVHDPGSSDKVYAFDFDNETFKLFPSPPVETIEGSQVRFQTLAVLKGCLCQSETFDSQFTMWVMKEYGIKKSWHKEVIIKQNISPNLNWLMCEPIYPIERLNNGTIMMVYDQDKLLIYSPQRKTVEDTGTFDGCVFGMPYRPSFLKLKNFESERIHVF